YNAKSLERAGGAICITERELSEDSLYDNVLGLLNDKARLEEMAKASRAFGKRDAIDQIYDRISAFL
ncbi:glycosyltransferase, partial [Peptostreptococcus stomatis]